MAKDDTKIRIRIYSVHYGKRPWVWDIISNNGYVIAESCCSYSRKWTAVRAVKRLMKNIKNVEVFLDG